jgi:hypothetical protein
MQKTILINGGIGRMICALPALERFITENPTGYIGMEGGLNLVLGNKLLQNRTYETNTKGIFENIFKHGEIFQPEPYHDYEYFNQKINIAQAFDKLINGSYNLESNYQPSIYLTKLEKTFGLSKCDEIKQDQKKNKTIVIQPFGRSSEIVNNTILDESTRSISLETFMQLVKELKKTYNIISMSEYEIPDDTHTTHIPNISIRDWYSIIQHADYFIGCDSVGQHLAYAANKPGSVILGSTFAENVTYPKHFNIIEKEGFEKTYSPIRINNFGCYEADQLNDTAMDFNEDETKKLIDNILADIKAKL